MSTIIPNGTGVKLGTTFRLSNLRAMESWGADKFDRAPPSNGKNASAPSSSANGEERRKIPRGEPCFVTTRLSYVHECAHLINAIRGKEPKHEDADDKLLSYLEQQGIVIIIDFTLDHPSNLINLDIWLHKAMDTYAMFALTCSNATLDTLIGILEAENKIADTNTARKRNYTRDLQIEHMSEAARYEMVVLHPRHFLPKDTHLLCYHSGEPMLYGANSVGLLEEDSTKSAFPELNPPDRDGDNRLNPYLIVLAAEIKFRRFRKSPDRHELPLEYETLIDKTVKVADLLYYMPRGEAWAKRFLPIANDAMIVDATDAGSEKSSRREIGYKTEGPDEAGGSTARPRRGGNPRRRTDGTVDNFDPRVLLFGHDDVADPDDLELLREMAQGGPVPTEVRSHQVEAWRHSVLPEERVY